MSKKEMETLLRYRLKVDLFRQWLSEFKDIAHVLDTLNATVEGTEGLNAGTPVAMEFCTIDGLREQIRKMRKEAADHIAALEQESAANLQRALVAEKDASNWKKFSRVMRSGHLRGAGHGNRIKIVKTCPMFGEEDEISLDDVIKRIADSEGM